MKLFFDNQGRLTIGKIHANKHHTKIPQSYIDWASSELQGFASQIKHLREGRTPSGRETEERKRPTGRRYVLTGSRSVFVPRVHDGEVGNNHGDDQNNNELRSDAFSLPGD